MRGIGSEASMSVDKVARRRSTPLMQGRPVGYDAERMIFVFTMLHGAKIIDCEISSAALDHSRGREGHAAQRKGGAVHASSRYDRAHNIGHLRHKGHAIERDDPHFLEAHQGSIMWLRGWFCAARQYSKERYLENDSRIAERPSYAMLLVVGGASIVWCGIVWVAATSGFSADEIVVPSPLAVARCCRRGIEWRCVFAAP